MKRILAIIPLALLSCNSEKKFLARCSKYCKSEIVVVSRDTSIYNLSKTELLPLLPSYSGRVGAYQIDSSKKSIVITCNSDVITIEKTVRYEDSSAIVSLRNSTSVTEGELRKSISILKMDNDSLISQLASVSAKAKSYFRIILFLLLLLLLIVALLIYFIYRLAKKSISSAIIPTNLK